MSGRGNSIAFCEITAVLMACLVFPCMAKEPHSARDYFERGLARAHAGDFDNAMEDFTNAIELNSDFNIGTLKRVKHLKSDLDKEAQPDFPGGPMVIDRFNALAYYNRGNLRMNKGDLNGAIDDFDKAVTLDPHLGRAFNNRGFAKCQVGDTDGATRDFDRSVQLDPQNPEAYYNRGIFRHKVQDFVGAIANYSRAIELNPHMATAIQDRGNAYLNQSNLDEAYRDFDRAIELDPSLFTAYEGRGLVLILQGKDAEAETDFAHYLQYAGNKKDELAKLVQRARESHLALAYK